MSRQDQALAVWLLSLAQTSGYVAQMFVFGALYVALSDPATGTGIAPTAMAAGPTAGLVLAAVLAPFAGRLVDRGLGPALMTFGPVFGAAGLILAALAGGREWVWLAGFLIVGLAQATTQFETCFAFLTRELGGEARAAIMRVALVAGLAPTVAFPLGDALARGFGWQGALIGFALFNLAVTVPLNRVGTRVLAGGPHGEARGAEASEGGDGAVRRALGTAGFWMLAAMLGLIWMNHMMLTTFAVPLMMDRGAGHGTAVLLAALIGPAQVAGRLVLLLSGDDFRTGRLTIWILVGFVVSAAALAMGGLGLGLLVAFAVVQGVAAGIMSILRPLLAAEVLGRAGFGAVWGALSVAPLTAQASAPLAGAALIDRFGAAGPVAAGAAMAAVGLALGVRLVRAAR